jgi:hypothetical protein
MKIGIDISTVLNHGKDVGAGRYIVNLVKNLFEIDSEDEFILTGRYITDEYLWLAEELKQHYLEVNERASKPASCNSNPLSDNNTEEKFSKGTDKTRPAKINQASYLSSLLKPPKKNLTCQTGSVFRHWSFMDLKLVSSTALTF